MKAVLVILVLIGGLVTVAVLLFTMKGRPQMSGARPPPAETHAH
jgi:hypothetical protein